MSGSGTVRRRVRALVTVTLTCLILVPDLGGSAHAAVGDGIARKSMFLDLGGSSPENVASRVKRICAEHRDPSRDNYIMNVVIVGVVNPQGKLRADHLRAVLPHVPGGGAEPCFENVFIGPAHLDTSTVPWKGRPDFNPNLEAWCADSPYCGGILTPSWRWDNLNANRAAAEKFLQFVNKEFPKVRSTVQWYVTYEAYFDWLGDNNYSNAVRAAYESYLLEMARIYNHALRAAGERPKRASRAILWSPAYENSYYSHSYHELNRIRDNLRLTLQNVQRIAREEGIARGVDWLDMQDKLGQTECFSVECYDGVRQWYHFLTTVNFKHFSFASLRVNMELFSSNQPGPDPLEHAKRQDFYEFHGIPIGASWELRFWNPKV